MTHCGNGGRILKARQVAVITYTVIVMSIVMVIAFRDTVPTMKMNFSVTVDAKVVALSGLRITDMNEPWIMQVCIPRIALYRLGQVIPGVLIKTGS